MTDGTDGDLELDELAESWLKLNLQGLRPGWHIGLDLSCGKAHVAKTIGIDWGTYAVCCCGPRGKKWQNGKAVPAVRRAGVKLELGQEEVEAIIEVFF